MLLLNAMRTTAVHAHQSFQLPAAPSEETVPETPATGTVGRSSVTPAPALGGVATRAPSIAPTPQEPVKGPPGGGKKKKKSESRIIQFHEPEIELLFLYRDHYPSPTGTVNMQHALACCCNPYRRTAYGLPLSVLSRIPRLTTERYELRSSCGCSVQYVIWQCITNCIPLQCAPSHGHRHFECAIVLLRHTTRPPTSGIV